MRRYPEFAGRNLRQDSPRRLLTQRTNQIRFADLGCAYPLLLTEERVVCLLIAVRVTRALILAILPASQEQSMTTPAAKRPPKPVLVSSDESWSLPAWTYSDPDFMALEREKIFLPAWHLVCHVSDIPRPGDWRGLKRVA